MAAAAALWARHEWVQAPGMGAWCEHTPNVFPCPWRELVIQAFINHRLSSVALALGAFAWGLIGSTRLLPTLSAGMRRWATSASVACAWWGLLVATCGLVLYDADLSAVALLCCMLAVSKAAAELR